MLILNHLFNVLEKLATEIFNNELDYLSYLSKIDDFVGGNQKAMASFILESISPVILFICEEYVDESDSRGVLLLRSYHWGQIEMANVFF